MSHLDGNIPENQNASETNFDRVINHDTGLLESICLRCHVLVCASQDMGVNLQREKAHRCPREATEKGRDL